MGEGRADQGWLFPGPERVETKISAPESPATFARVEPKYRRAPSREREGRDSGVVLLTFANRCGGDHGSAEVLGSDGRRAQHHLEHDSDASHQGTSARLPQRVHRARLMPRGCLSDLVGVKP